MLSQNLILSAGQKQSRRMLRRLDGLQLIPALSFAAVVPQN
jgi:hypothetical protein